MTYAHDFIVLVYLTTWTAVKLGIFTHITFTKLRRCSQSINSLIYVYSIQLLFMTAWSQLLSYFFVPSPPKKIFYITLCYCTPTHPPPPLEKTIPRLIFCTISLGLSESVINSYYTNYISALAPAYVPDTEYVSIIFPVFFLRFHLEEGEKSSVLLLYVVDAINIFKNLENFVWP